MRERTKKVGRRGLRSLAVAATVAVAVVAALALAEQEPSEEAAAAEAEPAHVEAVSGTDRSRVTLTPSAARRLRLETATLALRTVSVDGERRRRTVVPYSAVVYAEDGTTWVYVSPRRLTFERAPITIEDIQGDLAILTSGPHVGTVVATAGVPEIYGSEFGVDH